MELLTNKSPELELETLLENYRGQSVKVDNLLRDSLHPDWIELLLGKIRELEKEGNVYVSRFPRIEHSALRRDIRLSDIVHFDTFPSITRKTLLYQTKVEYGDYTINHLLGCTHGCQYPCYAMNISKRWGRVADYEDWMHPKLISNALSLLDQELPKIKEDISFIHLSFMTDPFMYDAVNERTIPWVENLTLDLVKKINNSGIKVTLLTKGIVSQSLKDDEFIKENEYGITLVSLDTEFHSQYEPYSAPSEKRLEALKDLHEDGLTTWISLEPYPTPNIVEQDLDELLHRISFVDKIVFGRWNYNPEVNGHEGVAKFYKECSKKVYDFCRENRIILHIKHGTPMSSTKSNGLFHE